MQRRLIVAGDNKLSTSRSRSAGGVGRSRATPVTTTRSEEYRTALTSLDSGRVTDAGALQELLDVIESELQECGVPELPAGLVGECFLGPPYRVHTIDLTGQIARHFAAGEAMPPLFERARSLALHPAYAVVEVYPNHLVAIRDDGTAVEI